MQLMNRKSCATSMCIVRVKLEFIQLDAILAPAAL